jgi:hypothetical protein
MGVKLAAASGGSIELVPTNTASSFTVTVPAVTGNVMVDGPAFSAYLSADQTTTSTATTKVAFNVEVFDTNSNYDKDTNYRFQPTVAGYYQVNANMAGQSSATLTLLLGNIYKNGSAYRINPLINTTSNTRGSMSDLIYMNGATDYLEIYVRLDGTGTLTFASGATASSFSASLVRGA